jgi:hypothetical protein
MKLSRAAKSLNTLESKKVKQHFGFILHLSVLQSLINQISVPQAKKV